MRFTETVKAECLLPGQAYADKDAILQAAVDLAKRCPLLHDVSAERILDGFREREAVSSTGIGKGIALPHCRLDGVPDFVVGMMTLATPVDFDAIDGEPVRIVAFIVAPETDTADHPRILSGLSLRLAAAEDRERLLAATTPGELHAILCPPPDPADAGVAGPKDERRLLTVIVQDEDVFMPVLEAVESIDGATAVVLDCTNAGEFLVRQPVFASFLATGPTPFARLILATVSRNLTNEALRRIEAITGPLDRRGDVAVIVQDIHHMAGSLGF